MLFFNVSMIFSHIIMYNTLQYLDNCKAYDMYMINYYYQVFRVIWWTWRHYFVRKYIGINMHFELIVLLTRSIHKYLQDALITKTLRVVDSLLFSCMHLDHLKYAVVIFIAVYKLVMVFPVISFTINYSSVWTKSNNIIREKNIWKINTSTEFSEMDLIPLMEKFKKPTKDLVQKMIYCCVICLPKYLHYMLHLMLFMMTCFLMNGSMSLSISQFDCHYIPVLMNRLASVYFSNSL